MAALFTAMAFLTAPHVALAASGKAHPAVKYMENVASDLIKAQRTGTISAFSNVIRKHADVPEIANYSLGRYREKLKKSQRNAYYTGVRRFMSRYFADQSKKYQVSRAEIGTNISKSEGDIIVPTKVYLASGSTYNVSWRLAPRRGSYRITDVKVLGFSMTYMQRNLFYNFLAKRDGDLKQLVTALNR